MQEEKLRARVTLAMTGVTMNKFVLCLILGLVGCDPAHEAPMVTSTKVAYSGNEFISAVDLEDSIRCYTIQGSAISCVHIPSESTSSEWHVNETCSN